jgi:RNA polymerase sigma factor (sigma-70 family)
MAARQHRTLWLCLGRMDEGDREVLILHHLEDTPLIEIARMLEITETAAKQRARRARLRFRALWEGLEKGRAL